MSTPLLVDDSHPSVHYSPARVWKAETGLAPAVNKTLHGGNTTGLVSLAFEGTGMQVYTMRGRALPTTSYTIDGVQLATVRTPDSGGQTSFNYITFSRRNLTAGPHVLTIKVLNGTFHLDYFLIDGSLQQGDNLAGSQTSSLADPATPSASESGATSSSPQSATRTVTIITATVGGTLLVILAMLGFWLSRRRGRRKRREYNTMLSHHVNPLISSSHRTLPRRTSSASLEKAPNDIDNDSDTISVAACTAPTSPGSPSVTSAPAATVGRGYRSKRRPRMPTKPPEIRMQVAARHSEDSEAATASVAPLSLPPDVENALSGASPEVQSGVVHVLRSLFSRRASQGVGHARGREQAEVDSGVRIVVERDVPPPEYTAE